MAGAALGSKLLFFLEDPQLTWHNLNDPAYLIGGKTIVGALTFGLITVELTKRYIGIRDSTGDLYAIPLALGIAIGRIGCFLTGLSDNTYGSPTNFPWAVNFGDGIPRHPTQLYEIIFLLALIPFLYRVLIKIVQNRIVINKTVILSGASSSRSEGDAQSKDPHPHNKSRPARTGNAIDAERNREGHDFSRAEKPSESFAASAAEGAPPFLPGDDFKFFMVAYMSFRLLCDFIKPYPRLFLGLGGIQWACVFILLYYFPDIARWLKFSKHRR